MNIQPDYIPMVNLLLTLLAIQKRANPDDDKEGLVGAMGLEQTYNDIFKRNRWSCVFLKKDIYGNALPGTVAEEKKQWMVKIFIQR